MAYTNEAVHHALRQGLSDSPLSTALYRALVLVIVPA